MKKSLVWSIFFLTIPFLQTQIAAISFSATSDQNKRFFAEITAFTDSIGQALMECSAYSHRDALASTVIKVIYLGRKALKGQKKYVTESGSIIGDADKIALSIQKQLRKAIEKESPHSPNLIFHYIGHNNSFIHGNYSPTDKTTKNFQFKQVLMVALDRLLKNKKFKTFRKDIKNVKFRSFFWQACSTFHNDLNHYEKIFKVFNPKTIFVSSGTISYFYNKFSSLAKSFSGIPRDLNLLERSFAKPPDAFIYQITKKSLSEYKSKGYDSIYARMQVHGLSTKRTRIPHITRGYLTRDQIVKNAKSPMEHGW